VIVDDGSTDRSVARIHEWHEANPAWTLRVVPGSSRGPAAAMNTGIAAVSSDIIVRLDGHCIPGPDYLQRAVALVADDRVGVAGGGWDVKPGASTPVARAIARVVSHPMGSGGARYRQPDPVHTGPEPVETVPFGTFRRRLWEQLGGFDEALLVNEDFDFNYRARRAGYAVVFDGAIRAAYLARPTLTALARQYFRYGYWKRQMLRKDTKALHWRQLPPILILPWVIASTGLAVRFPGPVTWLMAAGYPAALVVTAARLAMGGTSAAAAAAALATVHVSWSAGFWRGVFSGRPLALRPLIRQ
jgi:GT2 family glycosyltransferase